MRNRKRTERTHRCRNFRIHFIAEFYSFILSSTSIYIDDRIRQHPDAEAIFYTNIKTDQIEKFANALFREHNPIPFPHTICVCAQMENFRSYKLKLSSQSAQHRFIQFSNWASCTVILDSMQTAREEVWWIRWKSRIVWIDGAIEMCIHRVCVCLRCIFLCRTSTYANILYPWINRTRKTLKISKNIYLSVGWSDVCIVIRAVMFIVSIEMTSENHIVIIRCYRRFIIVGERTRQQRQPNASVLCVPLKSAYYHIEMHSHYAHISTYTL